MAAARARLAPPPAATPRNDVYTVLLLISLVAMILGTVLLYLDYARYPEKKPSPPPARVIAPAQNAPGGTTTPPQGQPPQGQGGAPAGQPGAGAPPAPPPAPPAGGNAPKPPGT